MVYVNDVEIDIVSDETKVLGNISPHKSSELVTLVYQLTRKRSMNESISIMLRSYTRAIQKQNKLTGSLFQHRTKAICLTKIDGITPAWFQTQYGTVINIIDPEKEYLQVCFNYIHQNPVKSGFVKTLEEWEFSSFPDYAGKRNGTLINREMAEEFGLQI